jgi:hypothetical protein
MSHIESAGEESRGQVEDRPTRPVGTHPTCADGRSEQCQRAGGSGRRPGATRDSRPVVLLLAGTRPHRPLATSPPRVTACGARRRDLPPRSDLRRDGLRPDPRYPDPGRHHHPTCRRVARPVQRVEPGLRRADHDRCHRHVHLLLHGGRSSPQACRAASRWSRLHFARWIGGRAVRRCHHHPTCGPRATTRQDGSTVRPDDRTLRASL